MVTAKASAMRNALTSVDRRRATRDVIAQTIARDRKSHFGSRYASILGDVSNRLHDFYEKTTEASERGFAQKIVEVQT